jgi:hypothetical protein
MQVTCQLADGASLTHQMAEIRRRYGDSLEAVLKK